MKKVFAIVMMVVFAMTAIAQQDVHVGNEPQQKKKKKNNIDEAETLFDYTKQVISSNASFQFAIIANPEINAKDTANSPFKQALKELQFRTDIAFIVVLGNITADGSTASLETAREMLKKSEKQFYVVPGRKDILLSNAGGTEFKRVFGDDCFRANVNGVFFLGINTTQLVDAEKGHFLPQKGTWLKNQLKNAGKKIPVFIFTTNSLNNSGVDNWYAVTDIARHYNVQMVVDNQRDAFVKDSIDGIPMRGIESLPKSYTICKVHGDTMIAYSKLLKSMSTPIDTVGIEAKMYLEPDMTLRPAKEAETTKKAWTFQAPTAVYTTVAASENFCYFGDDQGAIYCLDLKRGKMKWKYQTAQRIVAKPLIVGDMVLVGSCDKNLYCLDAQKGTFKWRVRTGRPVMGQPAIVDSMVYIDMNDTMLFKIDLKTGEEFRPVRRETISMPPVELPKNGETPLNDLEYVVSTVDGVISKYALKKE